MLHAKNQAEVRADLEMLLKNVQQTNISLFNIDIDFFMHYYDIFGPEQEMNALNTIGHLLSSLDAVNYRTLFSHHGDESESKIYKNHFLAASFGKIDPTDMGQKIKGAIEGLSIPLHDSNLRPRECGVEVGRMAIIDPQKVTVHMGVSRYAGYNPDVSELIRLAMEAEEKAKTSESRIFILP